MTINPPESNPSNPSNPFQSRILPSVLNGIGLTYSILMLCFAAAVILFLSTPLSFIAADQRTLGRSYSNTPMCLCCAQMFLPGMLILIASISLARVAATNPSKRLFAVLTAPYFFLVFSAVFLVTPQVFFSDKNPTTPAGIFGDITFNNLPLALVFLIALVSVGASALVSRFPKLSPIVLTLALTGFLVPVTCLIPILIYQDSFLIVYTGFNAAPACIAGLVLLGSWQLIKTRETSAP